MRLRYGTKRQIQDALYATKEPIVQELIPHLLLFIEEELPEPGPDWMIDLRPFHARLVDQYKFDTVSADRFIKRMNEIWVPILFRGMRKDMERSMRA